MSKNHDSKTKYEKQKLKTILQNKLICLMTIGLIEPLENSYPNNCSETPNCHQNLEMIVLKIFKVSTQWALVPFWMNLEPTIILKRQTVTKTLILLP